MNICGILVNSRPENVAAVTERLVAIAGIEVHAASDDGQMVITLEELEEDSTADKLFSIQDIEGVISASMIYHHNEDEDDSKVKELAINENEDLNRSIN